MPARSTIKQTLDEARARVTPLLDLWFALGEEERKFFLDEVDPIPEQPAAPVKKARKKRGTGTRSRRASGMAQAVAQSLESSRQATIDNANDDVATCAECPNGPDDNIHHKRSMEGYHEFKEAT